VGFPWAELLTRLASTLSDQKSGYPRLAKYITSALYDTLLIRYPLLHADVLFYKLDCSYAVGSSKYSSDSVTVDWERATSRLPGEDPISLAIRELPTPSLPSMTALPLPMFRYGTTHPSPMRLTAATANASAMTWPTLSVALI
jgi:hypothetical protein